MTIIKKNKKCTKKEVWPHGRKKQAMKTIQEGAPIVNLLEKDFKSIPVNIAKEIKKMMSKELKCKNGIMN